MASILGIASANAAIVDNSKALTTKAYVDAKVEQSSSSIFSVVNNKQDTISDLGTIRSGAAAGATALQASDVDQTYNATSTNAQSGTAVAEAIATVSSNVQDITTELAGKQDALNDTQLAAVNSGITAESKATYDGYATSKQDKIDENNKLSGALISDGSVDTTQLSAAVNSAINAANTALQSANITASNGFSVVSYNSDGLVTEGTPAGILATATVDENPCPTGRTCVVTRDAAGKYQFTPIINELEYHGM